MYGRKNHIQCLKIFQASKEVGHCSSEVVTANPPIFGSNEI